jgi:hypothetical protein
MPFIAFQADAWGKPSDQQQEILERTAGYTRGDVMKIATGILAAATLLMTQAGPAAAVTSKLSGAYVFVQSEHCEATLTTTSSAGKVTAVNVPKVGLNSGSIGTITFTPTTATSGNASVQADRVEGGSVRVNTNGFPTQTATDTFSAPYSFTATTFTLGSGLSAMVYKVRYGKLISGVAQTVYLLRKSEINEQSNTNCLSTTVGTKQ